MKLEDYKNFKQGKELGCPTYSIANLFQDIDVIKDYNHYLTKGGCAIEQQICIVGEISNDFILSPVFYTSWNDKLTVLTDASVIDQASVEDNDAMILYLVVVHNSKLRHCLAMHKYNDRLVVMDSLLDKPYEITFDEFIKKNNVIELHRLDSKEKIKNNKCLAYTFDSDNDERK